MYSVLDYGQMAACGVRMDAYKRAIAGAVKPGSIVVDIGAGTGILSLLAVRAGARRVHAIEPNPAVWLIPELAAENGCADRIEVHPTTSFEVELPERADVVISDLRGSLSLHGDHLATLRDAKERLLKPGGTLMPMRDRLFVAAVDGRAMTATFERSAEGFLEHGFSARAAQSLFRHTVLGDWSSKIHASDVLTTAAPWATIEYGAAPPRLDEEVELTTTRLGTADGLALWFEATIADGIVFDTAPGMALVYSRTFLPFVEPLRLDEGDRLRVTLRADERGTRWAWDTHHLNAAGATKVRFRQSTFLGMPTSPSALLRASSSHAPSRSPRGDRVQQILNLMDGDHSVDEITEALRASSPASMTRDALLEEVREAVERYAR
jgi:protein arginine N-methyltransferase 1